MYDIYTYDELFNSASINWYSPSPNRYFQANFANGIAANATNYSHLDFRVSRRRNDFPASSVTTNSLNLTEFSNFQIQLIFNNGNISKPVSIAKYIALGGPVGTAGVQYNPVLQTVRIPLSDFVLASPPEIKAVRFIFNDTSKGAIFLSNVRLTQ